MYPRVQRSDFGRRRVAQLDAVRRAGAVLLSKQRRSRKRLKEYLERLDELAEAAKALPDEPSAAPTEFGQALGAAITQFSEASLARMRESQAGGALSLGAPPAPAPKRAAADQSPLGTPEKAAEPAAGSGATQQDREVDEARGIRRLRHESKMKKKLESTLDGAFGGMGSAGASGPGARS